jgi:hypothetical protein
MRLFKRCMSVASGAYYFPIILMFISFALSISCRYIIWLFIFLKIPLYHLKFISKPARRGLLMKVNLRY